LVLAHKIFFFPSGRENYISIIQLINYWYVADRVFDPTMLTETVYEEGAKVTALSALTGINGMKLVTFSILIAKFIL
jgi:hypothetical protein